MSIGGSAACNSSACGLGGVSGFGFRGGAFRLRRPDFVVGVFWSVLDIVLISPNPQPKESASAMFTPESRFPVVRCAALVW
jgi:hypothetical protein